MSKWKTKETEKKMKKLLAFYASQPRKNKVKRKPLSEETKAKISASLKGKKQSEKQRVNAAKARTGKPTAKRGKNYPHRQGENSWNWKGGTTATQSVARIKRKKKLWKAGGSHSKQEWELVKAQYNWCCPSCKQHEPDIKLTKDHIIPVNKGGSDNIENIQPLCLRCNCKKKTKIIRYEPELVVIKELL